MGLEIHECWFEFGKRTTSVLPETEDVPLIRVQLRELNVRVLVSTFSTGLLSVVVIFGTKIKRL